jgi:hypothetical protein
MSFDHKWTKLPHQMNPNKDQKMISLPNPQSFIALRNGAILDEYD